MKVLGRIMAAVALLSVAGCAELLNDRQPTVAQPITYGPATEKQVMRALQRFSAATLAMDANAIANMYAPDGVWERQSGPLKGRDAIRSALASTGGVRVLSNEMNMTYMTYNGPAVVQTGEFKQTAQLPDGRVVNADGRFEATWIHGPGGEWWIRRMVVLPGK